MSPPTLAKRPFNDMDRIVSSFRALLDVQTPGYDMKTLFWDPSMHQLIPRMDGAPALAASADAFTTCIQDVQAGKMQVSAHAISQYGKAISAVQRSIRSPKTAYTAENLYAILLLTVCHAWMSPLGELGGSHWGGILHLSGALTDQVLKDDFVTHTIGSAANILVRSSGLSVSLGSRYANAFTLSPFQALFSNTKDIINRCFKTHSRLSSHFFLGIMKCAVR